MFSGNSSMSSRTVKCAGLHRFFTSSRTRIRGAPGVVAGGGGGGGGGGAPNPAMMTGGGAPNGCATGGGGGEGVRGSEDERETNSSGSGLRSRVRMWSSPGLERLSKAEIFRSASQPTSSSTWRYSWRTAMSRRALHERQRFFRSVGLVTYEHWMLSHFQPSQTKAAARSSMDHRTKLMINACRSYDNSRNLRPPMFLDQSIEVFQA